MEINYIKFFETAIICGEALIAVAGTYVIVKDYISEFIERRKSKHENS